MQRVYRVAPLLLLVAASLVALVRSGPMASGNRPAHAASLPPEEGLTGPIWDQPVGLAVSPDGQQVAVLNRGSASLAVADLDSGEILQRLALGGRPESLAAGADVLAVVDSTGDRLLWLAHDPSHGWRIERTTSTGMQPTFVTLSTDGTLAWVSSRLDQCVEAYARADGNRRFRVELPFPPHCLALHEDGKTLLVADAYRGNVAAIDAGTGSLVRAFEFPGTNIRGLAFHPTDGTFLMAHQILSERSMITRDAVFWGAIMTNNLRRVSLEDFLDPDGDPLTRARLHFLGDAGNGAGDPGMLVLTPAGHAVVCLSGTSEVALEHESAYAFLRLDVGPYPTAVALTPDARRAIVANTHGNSLSILDLRRRSEAGTIELGPTPELTAVQRGEKLFHDARLSLDGWYSCQSCHTDGHTNGVNADTLGDGTYGAPKNAPSLLGVAETPPWGWVGRFDTLRGQLESTLTHTMHGRRHPARVYEDLEAYLRTLRGRPLQADVALAESIAAGRRVFEREGCVRCHEGDALTTDAVFDVGLDDGLAGNHEFNPPSLRGVSRTAPYFHDGRASSLGAVLLEFQHQLEAPLEQDDLQNLLTYLRSL